MTPRWPEYVDARANLHSHMSRLRARVHSAGVRLLCEENGYRATVDSHAVDAHRFRDLVRTGRALPDAEHRSAVLREALALWRGPVLADVAGQRLRDRIAGDLTELRLTATGTAIDADLELGRHKEILGELRVLTAEHPLREHLVGQLMLALYRSGRQWEALDAYHRLRTRLMDEFGVEPTPALRARHTAILRHEQAIA